jgi:hypothetical protein
MKKLLLTIILFAFVANVSAQINVRSSGQVGIGISNPQHKLQVVGNTYVTGNLYWGSSASNFLATTDYFPITFKIYNVLAGFIGNLSQGDVSLGYGSLLNPSTTATYNTAIGSSALHLNTTGTYNSVLGSNALYVNTTGGSNTASGICALYLNTTGAYNTANGKNALIYNTTGSFNTAIGYESGCNNPNDLNNTTAIGYVAIVTASNQVRIGNSSVGSIGGYANWSNISDGRAKKNIQADVPGLDFINRLQPVTYNLDLDVMNNLLGIDKAKKDELEKDMPQELKDENEKAKKAKEYQVQTGFVAQDVEKTAKSIGYNFSGVEVDESVIYAWRYA